MEILLKVADTITNIIDGRLYGRADCGMGPCWLPITKLNDVYYIITGDCRCGGGYGSIKPINVGYALEAPRKPAEADPIPEAITLGEEIETPCTANVEAPGTCLKDTPGNRVPRAYSRVTKEQEEEYMWDPAWQGWASD